MPLINSPIFIEMKHWSNTASLNHVNHNLAGTLNRVVQGLEVVAQEVDTLGPGVALLNLHDTRLQQRVANLESRIARNVRQNTASRTQRTTAAGLLIAGIASILAMPVAIGAVSSKNCPVDSNHSAQACNLGICALTGATLGVVAGIVGLIALCCSAVPDRDNVAP